MQNVPWTVVQNAQVGPIAMKSGAHGEVTMSNDGEFVYKRIGRNGLGELPYEFVMEIISRERCRDIPPEISRILPVEAIEESPKHYVMRMRNVKVGDIWDLIESDKFQHMNIREIARDVVQAVRVLHSRGVAHRDIKDANVLVENDPANPEKHRAFLCDMSLATCSPHIVGDPFLPYTGKYRPPEVVYYGTRFDFRIDWFKADIYALGALIARMVSSAIWGSAAGSHPPNRREVERKMPNFPGRRAVLAMMRDNPFDRPTAEESMVALDLVVAPIPPLVVDQTPNALDPEICAFSQSKDFPPWIAEVACDIHKSLPADEQGGESRKFCVAMAAKIGVMVRERDTLSRGFIDAHKSDLKRLTGIVLRCATSRNAIHKMLQID